MKFITLLLRIQLWIQCHVLVSINANLLIQYKSAKRTTTKKNLFKIWKILLNQPWGYPWAYQAGKWTIVLVLTLATLLHQENCQYGSFKIWLIFTSRQTKFITSKSNRTKIGLNSLANRFHLLNNKIPLNWLNLSNVTFKVKCKTMFLK